VVTVLRRLLKGHRSSRCGGRPSGAGQRSRPEAKELWRPWRTVTQTRKRPFAKPLSMREEDSRVSPLETASRPAQHLVHELFLSAGSREVPFRERNSRRLKGKRRAVSPNPASASRMRCQEAIDGLRNSGIDLARLFIE